MALHEKLEVWKKDLIDMSKRNTLLYFKIDGVRPSGLLMRTHSVEWLYNQVVKQRHPVTEDAMGLPSREEDPLPLKRMERLRVQARDDEKERGVRSIYLAFGLLEWHESEHSASPTYSPLVLVPVSISRAGGQHEFAVSWDEDEEIEINPTLREWLQFSFRLTLPTYADIMAVSQIPEAQGSGEAGTRAQAVRRATRQSAPPLSAIFAAVEAAISSVRPSANNQ